ncbi:2-keto-4-pentenoate hydratase [bacterium LRH843]|nr:2-keto-4-pentenoate hydratase [bacterium LRH843]
MMIKEAASALIDAEIQKKPIEPFTSLEASISVDEAYQVQLEYVRNKVENGAVVAGKKIGLTSKAMQEMLGVNEPDYGHIFHDMTFKNGDSIPLNKFIQPKIEFEIGFVLKKDLTGPNVTELDVLDATDYIVPTIEVIDSRIKNWKIKLEDTVADNGSFGAAIKGDKRMALRDIDIANVVMNVYKNNKKIDSATGAAVMGNPVRAVVWLANALSRYGISLNEGELILSGSLSKAITIDEGDTFTAEFSQIGSVSISFT